jgi:hypothetical protein
MNPSQVTRLRWRWYPLLHVVLFQAGWFACVAGAAADRPYLGPLCALGLVAVHAALLRAPGDELRLALAAVVVGGISDSLLGLGGLISCAPFSKVLAPLWMLALWAMFALTLHTYARWLLGHPWIASLCGAVAGPLAYVAAAKLCAVRFPAGTTPALIAIAGEWALCTPVLAVLARHWDGQASARQPVHANPAIAAGGPGA